MTTPVPFHLLWRGREVRIRHGDPRLNAYSAVVQRLQSAMAITTEVETLRMVVAWETGYEVRVDDDGGTVRLRRR